MYRFCNNKGILGRTCLGGSMLPLNCISSVCALSSFGVSWVLNMLSSQISICFLDKNKPVHNLGH
jgi:hypothetical protein